MNELRTPIQPLSIQNIDLNDSVVINEDRTQEDYHSTIEILQLFFMFFQLFEELVAVIFLKPPTKIRKTDLKMNFFCFRKRSFDYLISTA